MGWQHLMCLVVVLTLTGIVGQDLDYDDPSLLIQNNINNGNNPAVLADWEERCRTDVGEDALNDIKESITNFTVCVQRLVKWNKLQHEINRSIPRGELDLVFRKYCGRRKRLTTCLEDVYTKLQRCMNDQEKQDLNITRKAIDAGIDFVCHDDGDRIALFMAENGEECVTSQKDNISACVTEKISEIKDAKQGFQDLSLAVFTINEDNCKKANVIHQCIVEYTEKCEDPTPSNILNSLIEQVLKVTPCWQTSSAPTLLSYNSYLLPHLLTLVAAALTAANILL